MSTPEEKLNSPTHSGPARCTLEQLRARWGRLEDNAGAGIPRAMADVALAKLLYVGGVLVFHGMDSAERWKVEKIEGKRVDLVQEVET